METLHKDKNSVLDYLTLQKTILSLVSDCNIVGNVQWLHFSHSKLLAWAGNCLIKYLKHIPKKLLVENNWHLRKKKLLSSVISKLSEKEWLTLPLRWAR